MKNCYGHKEVVHQIGNRHQQVKAEKDDNYLLTKEENEQNMNHYKDVFVNRHNHTPYDYIPSTGNDS